MFNQHVILQSRVKPVSNNCHAIECDLCLKWCHFKCLFLMLKQYNAISVTNDLWIWQVCCHNVFPFHDLDPSELLELTFNSNTECYCSSSIDFTRLENLPQFDFISSISNLQILSDHVPDLKNLKTLSIIPFTIFIPHQYFLDCLTNHFCSCTVMLGACQLIFTTYIICKIPLIIPLTLLPSLKLGFHLIKILL